MKTRLAENNLTTISQLLVGVNKMEPNIGLSETHGEVIGEKVETLDLLEVQITLVLSLLALGPLLLTPGLKM